MIGSLPWETKNSKRMIYPMPVSADSGNFLVIFYKLLLTWSLEAHVHLQPKPTMGLLLLHRYFPRLALLPDFFSNNIILWAVRVVHIAWHVESEFNSVFHFETGAKTDNKAIFLLATHSSPYNENKLCWRANHKPRVSVQQGIIVRKTYPPGSRRVIEYLTKCSIFLQTI